MSEHTPEEITIDPALRGFMIRIDGLVSEAGANAIHENGVDAPGITAYLLVSISLRCSLRSLLVWS